MIPVSEELLREKSYTKSTLRSVTRPSWYLSWEDDEDERIWWELHVERGSGTDDRSWTVSMRHFAGNGFRAVDEMTLRYGVWYMEELNEIYNWLTRNNYSNETQS